MHARARPVVLCLCAAACGDGGDHAPGAGRLTGGNLRDVAPPGITAQARAGDYYLRNDDVVFVIQDVETELGLGPYGGSLIDVALRGARPSADHFGELIPVLAIGRSIEVRAVRVLHDGRDGADARVRVTGSDALNTYYNLEGLAPGFFSFQPDGSGVLLHDPQAPLGLEITVDYTLARDEPRLRIRYTFTNTRDARLDVPVSFIVDSRGDLAAFVPGPGYQALVGGSVQQALQALLAEVEPAPFVVYEAEDMALAIVPRRVGDYAPPRSLVVQVPQLGALIALQARSPLAHAAEGSFRVEAGASVQVEVDVVAQAHAALVLERAWELVGEPLEGVSGCVTFDDGAPAPRVRVGLTRSDGMTLGTFVSDAAGCFAGRVPAGDYYVFAGQPGHAVAEAHVALPGSVHLVLPRRGRLRVDVAVYNDLDATTVTPLPCRLTLVGERGLTNHPGLGSDAGPSPAVHSMHVLPGCRGGVDLPPGRYLALVTRGPQFDRLAEIVDVTAGAEIVLTGGVRRVVDTQGYSACDFHVHSIYSPDSVVTPEARVLSLAAEALDFWVATDHDHVADFGGAIASLGLTAHLATRPGSEVTTFDLGHFGAYPLTLDASRRNGGAPDWALLNGARPNPGELFALIHERGALVQINHPRTSSSINAGAYFDRAGLAYDPITRQPLEQSDLQPVARAQLRLPAGAPLWSPDFDVIEVMNGTATYIDNGMVYERGSEGAGHDWMNLLSGGRRLAATANSDTHDLTVPPGLPRTYVFGHHSAPEALLAGLAAGRAVLSNGPALDARLVDASGQVARLGEVLTATTSTVTLRVHVETANWFRVDVAEMVANAFFPDPKDPTPPPLDVPLVTLSPVAQSRGNGGHALVADAELTLDLGAPPFLGRDGWVVVRAGGLSTPLFPLAPAASGVFDATAATAEEMLSNLGGPLPYAMTNAIYIDTDGDGLWQP